MKQLAITLLLFSIIFQVNAQEKQETPSPIIFIYDASGSMWGQMQGKTKMEIAADVLTTSVNNLPENQKIGLVAYGHRKKGDCTDVEFLVDVENGTKSEVNQSIKKIKPLGKTPLAYSALQVINKLRTTKLKATIILVTDGIESCGGNICDVIKNAKEEGIDFKLHIIGFGLKEGETQELKCAAEAGDGNYYDAADAGGLGDVLEEATATTIDDPEGNVSVYAVKNGVAIDAIVKAYDIIGKRKPISVRTYQDTAYFYLPPSKYNFEVTPLENSDVAMVTVANIESFDEKITHKTISFDGGKIQVTATNNGEGWDATVHVLEKKAGKTIAKGRTYGRSPEYEVNPGVYDVKIKILKINGLDIEYTIEDVNVIANKVISVEHNFKTGTVMIGAKDSEGLIDATVYFYEINTNKNVTGGRTYSSNTSNPKKFILTTGIYKVVVKSIKGASQGQKETYTITLKEGETIEKIKTF